MKERAVLQQEARRTGPDSIVYVPGGGDQVDKHNMHLIVTPLPEGTFLATWTQATTPHGPDQRVVVARSFDRGQTWSRPQIIDQPEPDTERIASWSSLVVVPHSGWVYCLYHKNIGAVDYNRAMTGVLARRVSEDGGETWGERFQTEIGRAAIDHPDARYPSNWVTAGWQLPIVTGRAQVLCPITRWSSRHHSQRPDFGDQHHEAWFLRFENILTETDPSRLAITTLPRGEHGIRVPHPVLEDSSAAMEPCIQSLADGRLLYLLRTMTGSLYYCLSKNCGETWNMPEELCFTLGGPPILHPNAPCPLLRLRDGRFLLLFHNNDGTANGGTGPKDSKGRRPVWLSIGRELDNAGSQPIVFGRPRQLYDNGGPSRPHAGSLALYGTLFEYAGTPYWWYADAMQFLLGKRMPAELLDDNWLPH